MNSMLGLVFAYRSFSGMRELVTPRTTSSVPFGGRYRAIDFCLSNLVNAGVTDVGVIMRDSYQSLMDHLGSGKDWDLSRKNGGLFLLPPFSYGGEIQNTGTTFSGKLDALAGVTSYIQHSREDMVVLAEGDCVTNIRLRDVLDQHLATGADITVVCTKQTVGDPRHSIYFRFGEDGRAVAIDSHPQQAGKNESLGMFIMKKELLLDLIQAGRAGDMVHFERGILRAMLHELRVLPYFHEGYTARFHNVAMYFRNSMALLEPAVRRDLFTRDNPVRTRVRDNAPTYYSDSAVVKNSLIADGCRIEGHVENSILFRNVRVASGATVKNSVIMQDGEIEENVFTSYIIADKRVHIGADNVLMGNAAYPVVIAKGSRL
ncbi:MAG: glucose-1-phosphate adenylyltransferase subunit GlgD [Clostridiaceae bacterium]|nr:glucose-1-phosphate adenylyltransferase subunit GlgD [Clostridiaceae bacterium]